MLKVVCSFYLTLPHGYHAGIRPVNHTMRITLPLIQPLVVFSVAPFRNSSHLRKRSGAHESAELIFIASTHTSVYGDEDAVGYDTCSSPTSRTRRLGRSPGLRETSCTARSTWIIVSPSLSPSIVTKPAASRVRVRICVLVRPSSPPFPDTARCDFSWCAAVRTTVLNELFVIR